MNTRNQPPICEWRNAFSFFQTAIGDRNTSHPTGRMSGSSSLGKPFVCDVCGRLFCYEDNFQVHLLTKHPEKYVATRTTTTRNPNRIEPPQFEQEMWENSLVSKDMVAEEARRGIPPFVGAFSYNLIAVNTNNGNLGPFNGVQGENNSCYIDASLMAMFFMNNTFDSLLSTDRDSLSSVMNEDIRYCKAFLTRHIVNSLRQRGFVEASFVMEWRRMIEPFFHGGIDFSNFCERHEACDFVRFLIETIGVQKNRSVSFGIESAKGAPNGAVTVMSEVMVQLLPPPNAERLTLSAEYLLGYFQDSQGLRFRDMAKSLILQLPRNGSKHRPVQAYVPDPILWVNQHNSLHGDSDRGSDKKVIRKVCFELKAVIVIETGHFVTYIRVPESGMRRIPSTDHDGTPRKIRWLYADSMSDRQFGYNVPLLLDVTDELAVLECPNAIHSITNQQPTKLSHLNRITQDASMLFYSRVCRPKRRGLLGAPQQTGNRMMKKKYDDVEEKKSNADSDQYPSWC